MINPVMCCATSDNASHDDVMLLSGECHTGMCHLLPWTLGQAFKDSTLLMQRNYEIFYEELKLSCYQPEVHILALRQSRQSKCLHVLHSALSLSVPWSNTSIIHHSSGLYLGLTHLLSSYYRTLHGKPASCKIRICCRASAC